MDFEKLGVFYLGKRYDLSARRRTDDLVLYDSRDLVTHAVCVGMTGSGKTGLCLALIEEAAIDGVPAILIDPKGDLGNLLLTFPSLAAADVRMNTSAAADTMRIGRSQWFGGRLACTGPGGGSSCRTSINALTAIASPAIGCMAMPRNNIVTTPNDTHPIRRHANHRSRVEPWPYARQNAATPTSPRSVPLAACAANTRPCCMAKKRSVGPATAGSAVTKAAARVPHRRAASVTSAMKIGTSTSLRTRST